MASSQLISNDYANLPAGIPPNGVMPDFAHPESRAYQAHVGMGVCIAIASVFLILRVYVRGIITHLWGLEDYSCILGFAFIVAHDVLSFLLMRHNGGLGIHIWDVRATNINKQYLQIALATINCYAASAFFVKLSLFLLYLRLFKPKRRIRWLIHGGVVACGLFYAASIIANCVLFMPQPGQPDDSASWLERQKKGNSETEQLAVVQVAFGTLSDIYLIVIPVHSIFQLHMPIERKFGVSAIFMVGIIAVACSVLSLIYRAKLLSVEDQTWFGLRVYIFSGAEISAGIICSCMPILAALFRDFAPGKIFRLPSFFRYFSAKLSASKSSHGRLSPEKTPGSLEHLHLGWTGNKSHLVSTAGRGQKTEWVILSDTRSDREA